MCLCDLQSRGNRSQNVNGCLYLHFYLHTDIPFLNEAIEMANVCIKLPALSFNSRFDLMNREGLGELTLANAYYKNLIDTSKAIPSCGNERHISAA